MFPTLVTGNMEEYVTKADQFLPQRWIKNSASEIQYKFHPFSSLPYGHGARMCLGRRFADLEMQVLLAKVSNNLKNLNFYCRGTRSALPETLKNKFSFSVNKKIQTRVSTQTSGLQSYFYVCARR